MTKRCTPFSPQSTGNLSRENVETRLRFALSVALHAWQRSGRRTIQQFADALRSEGVSVTPAQLRKWTAENAEDLRRSVPAGVVAAWSAVTGDTRPVDVLMDVACSKSEPLRDTMRSLLVELGVVIAQLNQIGMGVRAR